MGTGACWIWAAGEGRTREPQPAAFLAIGETGLSGTPASAKLAIVADEQYHLYVNSRWIGSNVLRPDAPLDTYEVAPYLIAGPNRVVVELFSRRGTGGLLVALTIGHEPEPRLVTDEQWRIVRHADADLYRPEVPIAGGEPPVVWAEAPTGRWRMGPSVLRPALVPALGEPTVVQPRRARCSGLQCPCAGSGCTWQRIDRWAEVLPPQAANEITLFDWGRTVVGYPLLDLAGTRDERALLATGDNAATLHSELQELVLPVSGAAFWHSAVPRRFRYLRVYGRALLRPPKVLVLDPDRAEQLLAAPFSWRGVFGLPSVERKADPIITEISVRVRSEGNPPREVPTG